MEKDTKKILKEFDNSKNLYSDFTTKCQTLIVDLLKNEGINFHQITQRVKERNKLERKILKKNHKYSVLSEITDIAGIRIITYFEDEVDKIAKIIETEFQIDKENSIDKRQLEDDKFGYRSLHYVISFNNDRSILSEYKNFINLKVEIQIRTILQHSWAEIEHDIGYKGEIEIPQFAKRSFSRIAALLETADIEFVKLKSVLNKYEHSITKEIKTAPENIGLDKTSLESFIKTNITLTEYNKKIIEYSKVTIYEFENYNDLIGRLNSIGIKTIRELNAALIKYAAESLNSFKKMHPQHERLSSCSRATFLYHLYYVLRDLN